MAGRSSALRGVVVRWLRHALASYAAMVKVHIIGLPSAGKTTLAAGLSSHFHVPHHDLDAVAFVDERWTMRPMADRVELVAQIVASPGFVTEGGFLGWVTPLFAAADRIVWLDPPLRVLIWRHIRRHGRLLQPQWLVARLRFQVLLLTSSLPVRDRRSLTRARRALSIEVALQSVPLGVTRS